MLPLIFWSLSLAQGLALVSRPAFLGGLPTSLTQPSPASPSLHWEVYTVRTDRRHHGILGSQSSNHRRNATEAVWTSPVTIRIHHPRRSSPSESPRVVGRHRCERRLRRRVQRGRHATRISTRFSNEESGFVLPGHVRLWRVPREQVSVGTIPLGSKTLNHTAI
ncbi:hypothetical protein VTI74DRAFT_10091 [Chaetomium olivicolor]